MAAPVALTVAIGLLGGPLVGDSDEAVIATRLFAVLLVTVAALVVVGRAGAWRRTGAAGPPTWREVGTLGIPAVVALAPLVTGVNLPEVSLLAALVVGYCATGVFEELWHRGVVLDTLRVLGVRRSAVVGGALFGASHLGNVVFGQPLAVSLAQSFGAFCFGVGFGVFRWRTNAIWLLAAIHAVSDLMFKVTNLHGGALWGFLVGNDILMLLWGLWCLRGLDDHVSQHDGPLAGE
ncbi:CPBP family intramembrane metalloprotease [Phycicoccus sp. HDW14]|uniref:CPBP family intramembrane glutamic endopeptidase n=1 Tax=Phycicoccus sp. HDW14 TaxID=2714941 RepID=UPI0014096F4A|nr:CPBP family intramembrane glutamic endopeptidase [Phycicoccus sp. HDW14]QIM19955.1 CPBP family intramembrane metalloprotease [Phycicoccus sp. HDW14]